MKEYFHDQPGSVPGTLRIDAGANPPTLVLIDYNSKESTWLDKIAPEVCQTYLETDSVSWVDVQGLGNEETWQQLGQVFNLHPLLLEDVVNVPQRPKVEQYENQLAIVSRMVLPATDREGFESEQVSLILGPHYLLTVQETSEHDCFEPIREQIRARKGTLCQRGPDYLTYALLDAIIDGFFPVLEACGERIERLEEEVISHPTPQTLKKIYKLRRELLGLRRLIWPQRSTINLLSRGAGEDLVSPEVQMYLRDCYDHIIQVLDMLETYRELASGLMDVYLSAVSNKMNEVMKILTVISTIFIPLTFIVGVYGMNFNPDSSPWNMPELNWSWGYPACWALMLAIAMGLVYFFWRRGWFENFSQIEHDRRL